MVLNGLKVDAGRATDTAQVKLDIAAVSQSVEVSAATQTVQTSNAEVSTTLAKNQIQSLPVINRSPLGFLLTQAGINFGQGSTTINGQRPTFTNVTIDGINIQDNYIRDNALDYTPNKLLLGQVRQMTLVSSNGNAASFGGATETAFSTPSGTNQFHGEALWYNRNNAFAANDWFNNQSGIPTPFLNQNQLGGPIRRDKLFFYTNYEAVRDHQETPVTTTVLTPSARNGDFTYGTTAGTTRTVNLLTLRGVTIDPVMQNLLNQVPTTINSSLVGDGLNTGGYRFNQRSNEIRDNVTVKLDYNLSTKHAISASYVWNRDDSDRPDTENDYSVIPKIFNPTH
jgi:hypothetical protein